MEKNTFSKKFIAATSEKSDHHRCIPAPYIRKTVNIEKEIKEAFITVCGLGFYRFWLSGKELTRGFLSPYICNPDGVLDYDRYDLTKLLKKGKNVLAFQLGNGMQNAFGGFVWDFEKASFRSAPKMAMCLKVVYTDGTDNVIEADESFLCHPSPIIRDELRLGEIYDANDEIEGWNLPDFDDSAWIPVINADTPFGETVICRAEPIVLRQKLLPVSIKFGKWVPASSKMHHYGYIYDFGLNAAGIAALRVKGKRGQKITITYGEHLVDGVFQTNNVSFIRKNLEVYPDYIQQTTYICRGDGIEEYKPSFAYFGFRYAFVEGIDESQATEELLTYEIMNTELCEVGNFSSSCEKLNTLQAMTRNATLSNFWHFPNDCPHREKNGWTADAALSAEHTLLNLNPYNNYYEWMRHIRAAMNDDGALPGIVPTGGWGFDWGNGPSWDQVIVELPFMSYRYLGKTEIIEENMNAIMRYVRYLETRKDEKGLIAIGLGDWLDPERIPGTNSVKNGKIKAPLVVTDSIMSMIICKKAAFLAKTIGRYDDEAYCKAAAERLKNDIRANLIDLETGVGAGECQTTQAMMIYYGIVEGEEKKRAFAKLLEYIEKEDNHLDTGVVGGRVIFHLLAEEGYADLAYEMITNPTPPSYAYWIDRGYTALAESFDTEDIHINSRNHHFWGDISAFFIKGICGINYNPCADDLEYLEIKPNFISALESARAYHNSPNGKIESSWFKAGDEVVLTLRVPDVIKYKVILPRGYKEIQTTKNGENITIKAMKLH